MIPMERRISLILAFIVLLAMTGFSQKSFSGRVLDATHSQPLIGAIIQLQSNGTGTITDQEGRFNVMYEKGDEVFLIKYLGYEDQRIEASSELTDGIIIELERAQTTLNEVIVSASPGSYRGDIKGSNFRISPIALKNMNPLSTEEVLRTVPGVNIIGDMGLSNRPNISIRGSWGRRSSKILLLEDGSPAAPAPYIAPGAYYNPVSDRLTSIEVYKGADMLRYSPNNMYGAVNYITALPPQQPQLRAKLIGGQRNYQTALISYGGTWQNLGTLVEGVYKKFDGFTDNAAMELLNLNAKIFARLSDKQSLYFKVSGQFEDNQASLSSQTPFTFDTDPTQNPFDADQFTMRRYGVDIIHKWLPMNNLSFTSKIYASDFERDWWRQITAKVKASEVENYVGEQIFNQRYGYLRGQTFGAEDYVIVGRLQNGQESTTNSRWIYTVSGFKETMEATWQWFGREQHLEASFNVHRETFKDRFIVADSSRWARSGRTTTDLWYRLWSANAFIRNEFNFGQWAITPILRFEHVDMYRQDLLALAKNPNIANTTQGRDPNVYNQFLPGITAEYRLSSGALYGSIYQGMIAPSAVFGFLVEQDGIITNPLAGQSINIDPELSLNKEIGWRGSLLGNRLDGQVTYFNIASRNFYLGGRNEVFKELAKINVQGLEVALTAQLLQKNKHQLRLNGSVNIMESRVASGRLVDTDLFSQVIHSAATQKEYIDKVNTHRDAFNVYIADGLGGKMLLMDETLDLDDFENIISSEITFGDGGIENGEAPYTPAWNANLGLNYFYGNLSSGISGHFVSDQYTEFHNFEAESDDGAIGKLPAFYSIDAYINYNFILGNKVQLNAFLNGKNITNDIYRASRLNRATSGVFGGGFRQIIFGVNLNL